MEKKEQKSVFEVLNAINVNEHTEKKNNLTYLSWAWAWAEVKKHYPDAQYTIYENANGFSPLAIFDFVNHYISEIIVVCLVLATSMILVIIC